MAGEAVSAQDKIKATGKDSREKHHVNKAKNILAGEKREGVRIGESDVQPDEGDLQRSTLAIRGNDDQKGKGHLQRGKLDITLRHVCTLRILCNII